MSIERMTFLGASVTGFNCSAGWGRESSTLSIQMVEDLRNGDAFIAPPVGAPVFASAGNFYFGGLLQNISYGESSQGKLFECSVVDPRDLLNGVQVILSDYTGSVSGIANMMNVYGFYESTSFGSSEANASGMSWIKIRSALISMANGVSLGFGGPIAYKGYLYGLDLTELPILPSDFRISGNASLMDIIMTVCDAGAVDVYFELIGNPTLNYIKARTISRAYVPRRGAITEFVSQTEGAVSKSIGEDMVNETCGKFLVGAKKRDVYMTIKNGPSHFFFRTTLNSSRLFVSSGPTNGFDNTIWPFWGFGTNGRPIAGQGIDDDHVFVLDSRRVLIPGVGNTYATSLGEIRAALASQEDWMTYLTIHNDIEKLMNEHGQNVAEFPTQGKKTSGRLKYRHNGVNNVHKGKAKRIGLFSGITTDVISLLADIITVQEGDIPFGRMIELIPGKRENSIEKLYNFIKDFAEEFYGLKFMVAIPELRAVAIPDSDIPRINAIPVDCGYMNDSSLAVGVSRNLVPPDLNKITNFENGMLRPYVRFDDINGLDFSEIPEDKVMFSANGQSIFVECSVDTDVYFLGANYTYPRVVVTLPGRVTAKKDSNVDSTFLARALRNIFIANFEENFSAKKEQEEANKKVKKAFSVPSLTFMFDDANCVDCAMPSMAAVPLESQVSRYGPWVALGAVGAMEYEQDDTLNPWTYSGFSKLDLAATAKVSDGTANLQYIESGAVEFPGLPNTSIGRQLLDSGPYISSISVQVGPEGVVTTYRMETWKIKFGVTNKLFSDRITKIEQEHIKSKRNLQELIKLNARRKGKGWANL